MFEQPGLEQTRACRLSSIPSTRRGQSFLDFLPPASVSGDRNLEGLVGAGSSRSTLMATQRAQAGRQGRPLFSNKGSKQMSLKSSLARVIGMALAAVITIPLAAVDAKAAEVIVQNGSFEDLPLADGQFEAFRVPGWTPNSGGAGTLNPSSTYAPPVPSGSNVAYLNAGVAGAIFDGEISQTVAESLRADNLYTLSFMLGRGFDSSIQAGQFFAELLAGDALLVSRRFTDADLPAGQFNPFSISYASQSDGSAPITIRFRSIYSGRDLTQALLDDVRLDASPIVATAVPEPSTWGLMLIGFGLIGTQMRRRRKTAYMMQLA